MDVTEADLLGELIMTSINAKAYKEILAVMDKYNDILEGDSQLDNRSSFKQRILLEEIEQEWGIPIKNKQYQSTNNIQLTHDNWAHRIIYYGSNDGDYKPISWSDDGRQPENERLYMISFPTGAFIFGQECPTETFNKFFDELKAFGPKYSDRMNKSLYFTKDVAKDVFEAFDGIYKKWQGEVEKELKQRRVDELKAELEGLESDV